MSSGSVRVLQTIEHDCGYYPDRLARNLVIDPDADDLPLIYGAIIASGFRRAGDLIFRPHCRNCQACVASRIPVERFRASRSQRRCLRRNADLDRRVAEAHFSDEHFELYRRYVDTQHPGGGMDQPKPEDFGDFLLSSWADSCFLEFRLQDRLLAVAVTDRLPSGYSAAYCFWEPELAQRGLGTLAILSQIELARRHQLPFVYLGYWLRNHPKMHYKMRYRPLQLFRDGRWVDAEDDPETGA